jgi:hypothetical protein
MNTYKLTTSNFTPLSQGELETLCDGIVKCKGVRLSPKDVIKIERENFTLTYAGDPIMNKLKECISGYFDVVQFDVETWIVKRKDYILTTDEYDICMNGCRYNGTEK